jgi:hypothetical protein
VSTTPPIPPKAKQQQKQQSIKQQRAAERARKLEEHRKREARAKRNRRIGIGAAIVGAVAIVALIITTVVLTPQPPSYTAGGEGADIEGVETFENESTHVETSVDYEQTPPAGGPHHPAWLNCGVYSEPVPNENAVHSLEHGAIWITYRPGLAPRQVEQLRSLARREDRVLVSPYPGLANPIVVSSWDTGCRSAPAATLGSTASCACSATTRTLRSPAVPAPAGRAADDEKGTRRARPRGSGRCRRRLRRFRGERGRRGAGGHQQTQVAEARRDPHSGQRKEKFSGPYTLRDGGYVLRFQRLGDEGRVTVSLESRKGSRQQPYELVLSDFDRQAARRNVTLTGRVYVHVQSSADGYLVRLTPRRPGR